MKLVDILARELKVWPDDSWDAVGQSNVGSLHEVHPPVDRLRWTDERYSMASDWTKAEVTKTQWQAAVDALKASDSGRYADLKALVDAIMYRMPSTPMEIAFESAKFALDQRDEMIKAIRTPERIAAEEIQKIRDEIRWQKPQLGPCPVEQMYLLGYRKFEIVDN